jgi:RNA polymerase sigma factor (sigma-70 family)
MKRGTELTQATFEELLDWLDPDREAAGKKYEYIRLRLIRIFTGRGCRIAEELADETIDRVAIKVREVSANYTGNPAAYFYGVAYKVLHEYQRKNPRVLSDLPDLAAPDEADHIEEVYDCLERCLQSLARDQRTLLLHYYQGSKQQKIKHRRELAEQLGIALNALRIRAFRIRTTLQHCVSKCLEEAGRVK